MDKKYKYLTIIICLCFVSLFLLVNSILLISNVTSKKNLLVIGEEGEETGIYSNIRPVSPLLLVTPKNNEIECLFEIYFSFGSKKFGEDKGEFLSDILIHFYDDKLNRITEYNFKGVILQANIKLDGVVWIKKEGYKRISSVYYEISEQDHYRNFNDLFYKDILKIRTQERKLTEQERQNKKLINRQERYWYQYDRSTAK